MSPEGDGDGFVTLGVGGVGFVVLGVAGDGLVSQEVVGADGNEPGRLVGDETVVGHGTGEKADVREVDSFYL